MVDKKRILGAAAAAALLLAALAALWIMVANRPPPPYTLVLVYSDEDASSYPEALGKGGYAITMLVGIMTGGYLNQSNTLVISPRQLDSVRGPNTSYVLVRGPNWGADSLGLRVFLDNRTVVVEGRSEEELEMAIDRLLVSIAGENALDVSPRGDQLVVLSPSGQRVGVQWLGGKRLDEVLAVPLLGGSGEDVRKAVLDGLARG